jgi:hypothetical protein
VDRPTVNENRPAAAFDGLAQLAEARRLTRAPETCEQAETVAGEVASTARGGSPAPLQFRLRTIFWLMVAAGTLFAVMQLIGAVWSAILVWFLVLVLAHVTANFWGTRIAPGQTQHGLEEEGRHERALRDVRGERAASVAVGAVRLSESARPGWPMFLVTGVGALVGGTLGGVSLFLLSLEQAGYTGVIVGTLSAAVVGGFLGFLTSTFAQIALRAWNEAVCGAPPPVAGEQKT